MDRCIPARILVAAWEAAFRIMLGGKSPKRLGFSDVSFSMVFRLKFRRTFFNIFKY